MNGSASRPNSATINGTRCAISPETKATSRDSRSSFDTTTQHLAVRATASAVASCGRRSRASGFVFHELGHDLQILGLGERRNVSALGLDAEPGPVLPFG